MKKLLIVAALSLLWAASAFSQTTINLTVQDSPDNQLWNNGTWSVKLQPPAGNLSQTNSFTLLSGGGSLSPQNGALSGTATAAITLPANANIAPGGTVWQFTVCPQASAGCFQQSVTVSTSSPQTLAINPPSIRINLATATPPISAYATGEISNAVVGSQFYLLGTGIQVCSAISGSTCTTWAASGGGISSVSSLPATCIPGVTAPVALSTPPYGTYYCNVTNQWSKGSMSSIDGAAFGMINAVAKIGDASWSSGGTAFTCPNSDCNFPFPYTGPTLKCFGVVSSTYAWGNSIGTAAITGTNAGTCTTGTNAVNTATANGALFVGQDSTTAILNATSALYGQCPNAANYDMPSGSFLLLQAIPPAPNACTSASAFPTGYAGSSAGIWIEGRGHKGTYIIPGPGFNFTNGSNTACFWGKSGGSNGGINIRGLQIDGLGANLSGISTAPCSTLLDMSGITNSGSDIFLQNWAESASNSPNGLATNGQSLFYSNLEVAHFGTNGLLAGTNVVHVGTYVNAKGVSFSCSGGSQCWDIGGAYNTNQANTVAIQVSTSPSLFQGLGTYTQDSGAANEVSLDVTTNASAVCYWCIFPQGAVAAATKVGIRLGSGTTVFLRDTQVSGGSTGGAVISNAAGQGTLVNEGGNSSVSGPFLFSGVYIDQTGTFGGAACTGVATASQTLGLYGTGPNVTATTCTSTTIGSGIIMPKAGTIFELLVTATAGGVNASSGLVTVLKNGAAQTMVCTLGTGTSCTDGTVAHFVTVAKGDLISLQFTTQAAETLAGVKASLIIW